MKRFQDYALVGTVGAIAIVLTLVLTQSVRATGTAPVTEERIGGIAKLTYSWTTGVTDTAASGVTSFAYTGKVVKVYIVPSSTYTPTDDFDVALYDEDGVDVLDGYGTDASTAPTVTVLSDVGVMANDTLQISVTGVSTSQAGIVYVYIERY